MRGTHMEHIVSKIGRRNIIHWKMLLFSSQAFRSLSDTDSRFMSLWLLPDRLIGCAVLSVRCKAGQKENEWQSYKAHNKLACYLMSFIWNISFTNQPNCLYLQRVMLPGRNNNPVLECFNTLWCSALPFIFARLKDVLLELVYVSSFVCFVPSKSYCYL